MSADDIRAQLEQLAIGESLELPHAQKRAVDRAIYKINCRRAERREVGSLVLERRNHGVLVVRRLDV